MLANKQIMLEGLIREYNEESEKSKDGWIIIKIPYKQWEKITKFVEGLA